MRLRARPKYGNKKTNGSASKREAKRLAELRLLQRAGHISYLQTQVPFELVPAQYVLGKCVERSVKYIADFVYEDNRPNRVGMPSVVVVEDTKGYRTPEYIIKRKLMLHVHKIRIREV